MNTADKQLLSSLGMPATGTSTDQTIGVTGDTNGAKRAAQAASMHAQRAQNCDRIAAAESDKQAAATERANAAEQRRQGRREQRAAWKAARQNKGAAA